MGTLNLSTVELVSTLRAAPENGASNSQDYNDSWTEALADLASLTGFLNDILIPMLDGLVATIMPNPQGSPNGLEGRYIYSDTSDLTPVFFDNLSNASLSIADSLRVINGVVSTIQGSINILDVEVASLQTQLSSTNQNDIAQALQNLAASLQSITSQTVSNTQAISAIVVDFQTNGTDNAVQNKLNIVAGSGITATNIAATGNVVIAAIPAPIAFNVSVQTNTGYTAVVGDTTKLITFSIASAETLLLPAAEPGAGWFIFVENNNVSAGILTISPNGLNLDGGSASITLDPNEGCIVFCDGSNYWTNRGMGNKPFDVGLFCPGLFTSSQVCAVIYIGRNATFPANLTGSSGALVVPPTGSIQFQIEHNGSSVGTANFAAGTGALTFTFAAPVTFAAGDYLIIIAPASADATAAGLSLTLVGTRN